MWRLRQLAGVLWASPWTAVGLAAGVLGLLTGGRARRGPGVIEFHGGAIAWVLAHLPVEPMALTLGHVILGRTAAALDLARPHELVHVRQYERWGPVMVPLYLLHCLRCRLAGKDPYRDNPLEREAFDRTCRDRHC